MEVQLVLVLVLCAVTFVPADSGIAGDKPESYEYRTPNYGGDHFDDEDENDEVPKWGPKQYWKMIVDKVLAKTGNGGSEADEEDDDEDLDMGPKQYWELIVNKALGNDDADENENGPDKGPKQYWKMIVDKVMGNDDADENENDPDKGPKQYWKMIVDKVMGNSDDEENDYDEDDDDEVLNRGPKQYWKMIMNKLLGRYRADDAEYNDDHDDDDDEEEDDREHDDDGVSWHDDYNEDHDDHEHKYDKYSDNSFMKFMKMIFGGGPKRSRPEINVPDWRQAWSTSNHDGYEDDDLDEDDDEEEIDHEHDGSYWRDDYDEDRDRDQHKYDSGDNPFMKLMKLIFGGGGRKNRGPRMPRRPSWGHEKPKWGAWPGGPLYPKKTRQRGPTGGIGKKIGSRFYSVAKKIFEMMQKYKERTQTVMSNKCSLNCGGRGKCANAFEIKNRYITAPKKCQACLRHRCKDGLDADCFVGAYKPCKDSCHAVMTENKKEMMKCATCISECKKEDEDRVDIPKTCSGDCTSRGKCGNTYMIENLIMTSPKKCQSCFKQACKNGVDAGCFLDTFKSCKAVCPNVSPKTKMEMKICDKCIYKCEHEGKIDEMPETCHSKCKSAGECDGIKETYAIKNVTMPPATECQSCIHKYEDRCDYDSDVICAVKARKSCKDVCPVIAAMNEAMVRCDACITKCEEAQYHDAEDWPTTAV